MTQAAINIPIANSVDMTVHITSVRYLEGVFGEVWIPLPCRQSMRICFS